MPPKPEKSATERIRGQCVDCLAAGITTLRLIHPDSGPRTPRCATHIRARKKARKAQAHANRTERNFGISGEEYQAIKEAQGGKCYICQRATGQRRNLAVDHDHTHCPGKTGCRKCVRALLCSPCNSMLAHARDDTSTLKRAIEVLQYKPAQIVLANLDKSKGE